jgi:hypothetical protein
LIKSVAQITVSIAAVALVTVAWLTWRVIKYGWRQLDGVPLPGEDWHE